MLRAVLLLALAVGCAAAAPGPTAPCTDSSPTGPTIAATPTIAPDRLAYWRDIRTKDFAVPAGTTAEALLPELVGFLASPDPAVRDELAYEVLAAWIVEKQVLAPPALRTLATALMGNVAAPHDPAPDAVFRRSFSALALSMVVSRELKTPFLTPDELHGQVAAAATYAAVEADLRGHVGAHGWAHAAAHTADWLDRLARHPGLTRGDAVAIAGAIADLTLRRHGHNLHHGEDGRLSAPLMDLLRRDRLDKDAWGPWVDRMLAPFREEGAFDPARYAAQRNARNLLFTLFVLMSVEDKPSAAIQMALPIVRAAIVS